MLNDPLTLEEIVAGYQNTAKQNDLIHRQFTECTWANPMLAAHRRYVEENDLGFGDAAFHSLWLQLLAEAAVRFKRVRALEIGVFKGQVISLWAVIAKTLNLDVKISAITPLRGNPMPKSRIWNWLRYRVDSRFRDEIVNGNFYENANYEDLIRNLFCRFSVDFEQVQIHRGLSSDEKILAATAHENYEIVYVDGDHTYDGALRDFTAFGSKVTAGGWLVADDAGCDLLGSSFWKGHESVTRAARKLPELGFRNVLNVGHNRVYERIKR